MNCLELKNRVNTKMNFIQYLGLTKAVEHYSKKKNNYARIMKQNTQIQLKYSVDLKKDV